MAEVDVQQIGTSGVIGGTGYSNASAGGDKVIPGDSTFLHVKNGSAGSIDCIIATPGTVDGLAVADRTVSIAAGAEDWIYLPAEFYRNSADGFADITWSATASVTFKALKV